MDVIYESTKYRDRWTWLYFFICALFLAIGIYVLAQSQLSFATPIDLGIGGLGAALIAYELQFYRSVPFDVRLHEDGALRIKAKHGIYAHTAEQTTSITYTFGANAKLFLRVSGAIWHLPCTADEAEKVIATLASINPNLKVRRVDADFFPWARSLRGRDAHIERIDEPQGSRQEQSPASRLQGLKRAANGTFGLAKESAIRQTSCDSTCS